ncbi:hypothetical protein NAEGRDRAFT_57264 [Naegleria gruberi]|uniref:TPR domain-containing protein n=1 Tax=Naegleria gruberi TaxID=5762 RepID=D2V675_NAEGR|nr:uncharacterized protein NAEGRDRAFT_57264 [Naegleria gruberi]EFC47784.1 hypothetical protein NAEGRDRAFT_57264 [Naegleria gruberi]|eukprot:XP_002680528.1 hypothetical protein NAEGRDRAFT_57264 [Naegleria gruberi strain NEG-M]
MKCTSSSSSPLSPSSLKRKPSDCLDQEQDSNIMDPPSKKQNITSKANNFSHQHGIPLSCFIDEQIEENLNKYEEELKNGVSLNLFKCVNKMKVSENGIYVQYPGEANVYKTFYGFLSLVDMLRVAELNSIDDLFGRDYDSSTDHVLLNKIMRLCISSHNAKNGFSMIVVFQIIYQLTQFLIAERKAALEYMANNRHGEVEETNNNNSINLEDIAVCKIDRIFVSEFDPKKGELIKIGITYNQYQKENSHKIWNSEREAVEIYHLGKLLFDVVTWHYIGLDTLGMIIFQKPTKEVTVLQQVTQQLRNLYSKNGEKRTKLFQKVFTQWSDEQFKKDLENSKSKAPNDYFYFNEELGKTVEWMFAKSQEKYYGECITAALYETAMKKKRNLPKQTDPFFNSSSIFNFFSSNWQSSQVVTSEKIMRSFLFSKSRIQDTLLTIYLKRNPILQIRYIKNILHDMLDKLQEVPSQPLMDGYNYYSLFPNLEFFNKYSYLCRALSSLVFPIPSLRLKLDHWSFVELPQFISSYSSVTNAMEKGKIASYFAKNTFFNDENSKGTFNTALSQYGVADFSSSVIILKNIVQSHLISLENIIEEKSFIQSYIREASDAICYQDLFDSSSLRLELMLQELILCYSYMGKGLTEQKDFDNAMKYSEDSLKAIIMAWIILTKREKDYEQLPILMHEIKTSIDGVSTTDFDQLAITVDESKQIIKENYHSELSVVPNWFISTLFTVAYIYDHIEKFNDAVEIYSYVVNVCPTYSMAFNNRGICKYRISSPAVEFEGDTSLREEMSFYDYTLSSVLDYANVCPQVNRVCLLNIQSNLTDYDKIESRIEQMINFYQNIGYENLGEDLESYLTDEEVEMDIYEFWAKDRKERLIKDLNFCTIYKPTDTINDISEHLFDRSVNFQSLDMYDQAINDLTWCEELCKIEEKRQVIVDEDEESNSFFGGFPNFRSFQANLFYNRAVCYDAIGKYREAIDDLYQLLEIDGNDADARMILEELLESTNVQSRVS